MFLRFLFVSFCRIPFVEKVYQSNDCKINLSSKLLMQFIDAKKTLAFLSESA